MNYYYQYTVFNFRVMRTTILLLKTRFLSSLFGWSLSHFDIWTRNFWLISNGFFRFTDILHPTPTIVEGLSIYGLALFKEIVLARLF